MEIVFRQAGAWVCGRGVRGLRFFAASGAVASGILAAALNVGFGAAFAAPLPLLLLGCRRDASNIDKIDKKTEICPICQRFPIKTLTKLTLFKNFVQFVKFGSKIEAFVPGNLRIC